jgi:hypothetical protein
MAAPFFFSLSYGEAGLKASCRCFEFKTMQFIFALTRCHGGLTRDWNVSFNSKAYMPTPDFDIHRKTLFYPVGQQLPHKIAPTF